MESHTEGPVFREFAVRLPVPAADVVRALEPQGILAGLDVGRFQAGAEKVLLVAVTERRTREQMDTFVDALFSQSAGGSAGEALRAADAIVCTDWDSFEGPLNSPREMATHGYESPLVTSSPWFIARASDRVRIDSNYDTAGCRPPRD